MKAKSKKKAEKKKQSGVKSKGIIYVDIECSYSSGSKPFIGEICIIDDRCEEVLHYCFEDPREITSDQANEIFSQFTNNYVVFCDPVTDIGVIRKDLRRCGIKYKSSLVSIIDIQQIEKYLTNSKRQVSLRNLAKKYNIKPPIRFHDPYSDAWVIKHVFEKQLEKLNLNKNAYIS